jgi:phosphoribosylformylglycinamidine synthase PurS subunit
MKAHVWVMPKRTVLDPQGQAIQHALCSLGFTEVSEVRQGKFFVLDLNGLAREAALGTRGAGFRRNTDPNLDQDRGRESWPAAAAAEWCRGAKDEDALRSQPQQG